MKIPSTTENQQAAEIQGASDLSRRHFFKLAGGIAGAGILFTATNAVASSGNLSLGRGDTGLLNFLYILQQVEAAFYSQAVATPYAGIGERELLALKDVRDQEIAHNKQIRSQLGMDAVTAITPNFSAIDFSDRTSVLTHAATIEDMVVAGLNGAANSFTDHKSALAFGKMALAEANHAAYFTNLHTSGSFAGIDDNGMSGSLAPSVVMTNISAFLHTKFDATHLPNA